MEINNLLKTKFLNKKSCQLRLEAASIGDFLQRVSTALTCWPKFTAFYNAFQHRFLARPFAASPQEGRIKFWNTYWTPVRCFFLQSRMGFVKFRDLHPWMAGTDLHRIRWLRFCFMSDGHLRRHEDIYWAWERNLFPLAFPSGMRSPFRDWRYSMLSLKCSRPCQNINPNLIKTSW